MENRENPPMEKNEKNLQCPKFKIGCGQTLRTQWQGNSLFVIIKANSFPFLGLNVTTVGKGIHWKSLKTFFFFLRTEKSWAESFIEPPFRFGKGPAKGFFPKNFSSLTTFSLENLGRISFRPKRNQHKIFLLNPLNPFKGLRKFNYESLLKIHIQFNHFSPCLLGHCHELKFHVTQGGAEENFREIEISSLFWELFVRVSFARNTTQLWLHFQPRNLHNFQILHWKISKRKFGKDFFPPLRVHNREWKSFPIFLSKKLSRWGHARWLRGGRKEGNKGWIRKRLLFSSLVCFLFVFSFQKNKVNEL